MVHCGLQIELSVPLTEIEYEAFVLSVRHQLTTVQGQSPLLKFMDMILKMINYTSNRRPSAVQLHHKIIAIVKDYSIRNLNYTEITADNYPDMSKDAIATRYHIFDFNEPMSGLPWKLDTIRENLVAGSDELIMPFTLVNIVKDMESTWNLDISKPIDLENGKFLVV